MNRVAVAWGIPIAFIAALGTGDAIKYGQLQAFEKAHPELAEMTVQGVNGPIRSVLRLDNGNCIRLYIDQNPVPLDETPTSMVQAYVHAKRAEVNQALSNLGVANPEKINACEQ